MFKKSLLILVIILNIKAQHTQKENVKKIDRNNKEIANSRKHITDHSKRINDQLSNLTKKHDQIKKSESLSYKEYNKLITEYGTMVKSYNDNRSALCAKLPEIWSLKNKESTEYTPMERGCKEWIYRGNLLGRNIGKAIFKLGGYKFYAGWFKQRYNLGCIQRFINLGKTNDKNILHWRECYSKGIYAQVNFTLMKLREQEKNPNIVIPKVFVPFKSLEQKEKEIKKTIKSMKRASK